MLRGRSSSSDISQASGKHEAAFLNLDAMIDPSKLHIELVKLVTGERLMRLTETGSGLTIERKLDPHQAVVRQKERLLDVLEAALARDELQVLT